MLLQCSNCGAPLDGRAATQTIRCIYCRATHVKECLPVQQPVIPLGWTAPRTWTAPPEFAVAGRTFQAEEMGRYAMAYAVISTLASLFGVTMCFDHSAPAPAPAPEPAAIVPAGRHDKTLSCDGDQKLTYHLPRSRRAEVTVEASGRCRLVLIGGKLDASHIAIHVWESARVELHGVRVVMRRGATGGDFTGIAAAGDADVEAVDSTFDMDKTVEGRLVEARDRAHVRLYKTRATGNLVVSARDRAVVNVVASTVHARIDASRSSSIAGVSQ